MKKIRKPKGNKNQESQLKIEPTKLDKMDTQLTGNIKNEDSIENIVSEPQPLYDKKTLRIFSSLEEMNEEDAREMATVPSLEQLRNAVMRTRKIFAKELKKEMTKTIKFR